MNKAYALADKSEELYNNKKNVNRGYNFLFRCLELYFINNDIKMLQRGLIRSRQMLDENRQSICFALFCSLFEMESGFYEQSHKRLDKVKKYIKYLKANDTDNYSFYFYVKVMTELSQNGRRNYFKYIKYLQECDCVLSNIFLADIYIRIKSDYRRIGALLKSVYESGNRSRLFFIVLFKFFSYKNENNPFNELLTPLFKWGLARELDLKEIAEACADKISVGFFSLQMCLRLYKAYSGQKILSETVKMLIKNYDYTKSAYHIYKEAVARQIEASQLIPFLVKTSFKLGIEDIGIYPIQKYLHSEYAQEEIKAFVYHIILKDAKYAVLLEEYENEIISFGLNAFSMGYRGRYYFSLYKFITDRAEKYKISDGLCSEIFRILYPFSFIYEVETDNKKAAYIKIKHKDINKMSAYSLTNGKALISALSDNFTCYLLDKENKEILTGNFVCKKLVQNTDFNFYFKLYKKNYTDENIILFLAKNFPAYNENEAVDILKRAYKIKGISKSLKVKTAFRLGSIFYAEDKKNEAMEYFKAVDLNYISASNAERLLYIFAENNEFQSAVNALIKKPALFGEKILFFTIKKIAQDKSFNASISPFAYKLLINGKYDKSFVEAVNDGYNTSIGGWMALSQSLNKLKLPNRRIDERILKLSIITGELDEKTEDIFRAFYYAEPKSETTADFIYFLCYKVIIENKKLSTETLKILEREFKKSKNAVIAAAVSNIYINQAVTTDNFYDIIEEIKEIFEKNEISFPNFSKTKDKAFHNSYIDKYKAFCYRAPAGREIYICYKRNENGRLIKRRMKYFKFGLYILCLSVFSGEKIEYYFSEQREKGSIQTAPEVFVNSDENFYPEYDDEFFKINSAFVNQGMAKYDRVEAFISERILNETDIKGRLL